MSTARKERVNKTCTHCSVDFKGIARRGEFCSGRCRVQYWRERKGDTMLLDALIANHWRVEQRNLQDGSRWLVFDIGGVCRGRGVTTRQALIDAVNESRRLANNSVRTHSDGPID